MISVWGLLAVPFLIAVNAFFVIAEYGLVATRSGQIEQLKTTRPRAAAALRLLKTNMGSAIGTIQLCITMTNLMLGSIGEPAMTALLQKAFGPLAENPAFQPVSVALSFIVVTLLTVVLSEMVPKAVTLQYTLPLACMTAPVIAIIQTVLRPLVWVMDTLANLTTRALGLGKVSIEEGGVSADEFRHITAEAAASGTLTPRERSLILNSLTLGRRTATDVMVPRVRVNYLDIQFSMEKNLESINSYLFSRMPLCDGGMDRVIGVVYTKEFFPAYAEMPDSSVLLLIARPPMFAPEGIPLDKLLQRFRDDKTHMMFLVDEHGGVSGVVTLTDVIHELLGPILEGDDARIIERGESGLIVTGDMPISHLADYLGRPGWGDGFDVRSVGGLMVKKMGRVPRKDESLQLDGIALFAHQTTARTVEQVRVSTHPST